MSAKRKNLGNINRFTGQFKAIVIGGILGTVISGVLLMFLALVFTKSPNPPYNLVDPIMLITAGCGAFVSGYSSSRIYKEKGIICGITSGFLMFVFVFVSGFIFVRESLTEFTLIRCFIMLVLGALGGIIGVNKRRKR